MCKKLFLHTINSDKKKKITKQGLRLQFFKY